jgi:DNA gyrase subunit A
MGRTARGVRGIRLSEGDYVVGVALVDETKKLLTLTENGFGKRSDFEGFKVRNRGGKGVIVHGLSEKTGLLGAITVVSDEDDIVIICDNGMTIRTHAADISEYSRTASGVIVMRAGAGKVSAVANVGPATEDDEAEGEETEAVDGVEPSTEVTEAVEAADVDDAGSEE